MINNTFSREDANRILSIHLAREAHDDVLAWEGEGSGDFSTRSATNLYRSSQWILWQYIPTLRSYLQAFGK